MRPVHRTVVLVSLALVVLGIICGWVWIDTHTGHVDSYVTFISASIVPTLMSLAAYLRIDSTKQIVEKVQEQTNGHMTALIGKVGPVDPGKEENSSADQHDS